MTGQSIYYNYEQDNVVRLEMNKISLSDEFDVPLNFFSFDGYINSEFKVGGSNKIAVEIPFSRISIESFNGDNETEFSIGNVSVAYQIRSLNSPSYLEFKLRLPTGSDEAIFLASDYTERLSAIFIRSSWSIEPSYTFESNIEENIYFRLKPGAKLFIDVDDFFEDSFEGFFDLSGAIGYRDELIDINGGITSTTIFTQETDSFSERLFWQAFATASFKIGQFEPGLIFRLPLTGEFNDLYSPMVGVHLGYRFGGVPTDVLMDKE
jgi:hypothetical protein